MSKIEEPKSSDVDLDWIRRCQKGDSEAFGPIVQRYQSWVWSHCYRWVGDPQRAEDLAQEVFLKAFAKIKKFRGSSRFSTWLFRIMRNQCLDYFRKKENKKAIMQSLEDLKHQPALSPQAEFELTLKQIQWNVRRAISQLPKIYQESLLLRYLSELSYEEISHQLGQKESALKMRVARGLDMLRNKLKEGSQ